MNAGMNKIKSAITNESNHSKVSRSFLTGGGRRISLDNHSQVSQLSFIQFIFQNLGGIVNEFE